MFKNRNENDGMKTNVWIGSLHFCSSILLDEWNNMYFGKVHARMCMPYSSKWYIWLAATKHTSKYDTDFEYWFDVCEANAREQRTRQERRNNICILLCISYDFIHFLIALLSSRICQQPYVFPLYMYCMNKLFISLRSTPANNSNLGGVHQMIFLWILANICRLAANANDIWLFWSSVGFPLALNVCHLFRLFIDSNDESTYRIFLFTWNVDGHWIAEHCSIVCSLSWVLWVLRQKAEQFEHAWDNQGQKSFAYILFSIGKRKK